MLILRGVPVLMPKTRIQKKIDVAPATAAVGGAPASGASAVDIAPPALPSVDAPDSLSLSTSIGSSTAAPTAVISATWDAPPGVQVQRYVIQLSASSSFPSASTLTLTTVARSVRAEALQPGVLSYVRVAAVSQGFQGTWSDTASITTATDTVAAGVPTSVSAVWIGTGDLLITWTNPTEANLKDVQVVVRASSGGTIYRTTYSAAGRFLYPLAWNYQDTSGVGDSSLYVELKSRTFSNVLSSAVNTGLVTKSAPAAPSGLAQSWSGDTGAAGDDWTITWTRAEDAYRYRLAIDGTNRQFSGNSDTYTYTIDLNRSEHSGTPDPVLSYSLVAVDGFGQVSTAASGTATNAAPAAPGGLTSSWASDTGIAGPDCTISWTASAGATAGYRLTIDGIARDLLGTRYVYTLDADRSEHSGTPDPVLTISVVARDGFQSSSAATLTATNAAPPAPVVVLTAGAVSGIKTTVGGTQAADFAAYEYVFKRDGTTMRSLESAASEQDYEMSGAGDGGYHSWTCAVRQKDAFSQYSSTATSSAVAFEALTIASLRAQAAYTDSDGNSAATLAVLKDGITASGGVGYAA